MLSKTPNCETWACEKNLFVMNNISENVFKADTLTKNFFYIIPINDRLGLNQFMPLFLIFKIARRIATIFM
jgi:hypothetical protein